MGKLLNAFAGIAFLVAGLSTVHAGTKAGRLEVKGSSDLRAIFIDHETTDMSEHETTAFGGEIETNFFLTNNFSLGVGFEYYNTSDSDGGNEYDSTSLAFLGRGDFYFLTEGTVVPYVGFRTGHSSNSYDSNYSQRDTKSFFHGGQTGVKFFVSDSIALNCELVYAEYSSDWALHPADFDDEETRLYMVFGVSVFF